MESKKWYSSNTVQFFSAVLLTGGLDLITTFATSEELSWRSILVLICGLAGIAFRLKTSQPLG